MLKKLQLEHVIFVHTKLKKAQVNHRAAYTVSVGITPTAPRLMRSITGSSFQKSSPEGSTSTRSIPASPLFVRARPVTKETAVSARKSAKGEKKKRKKSTRLRQRLPRTGARRRTWAAWGCVCGEQRRWRRRGAERAGGDAKSGSGSGRGRRRGGRRTGRRRRPRWWGLRPLLRIFPWMDALRRGWAERLAGGRRWPAAVLGRELG